MAIAAPVAAEDAPAAADVGAAARDYFAGEAAQAHAWTAVGVVAITAGAFGIASDDDTARGAGYPVAIVGAIQLGAGVISYISPPRRARRAARAVAEDPAAYAAAERTRMRTVTRAFTALRIAEVALAVGGAGLAIGAAREDADFYVGLGGGIAFQAVVMLALDASAEHRAARYVERLAIGVTADGGGLVLGYAGTL